MNFLLVARPPNVFVFKSVLIFIWSQTYQMILLTGRFFVNTPFHLFTRICKNGWVTMSCFSAHAKKLCADWIPICFFNIFKNFRCYRPGENDRGSFSKLATWEKIFKSFRFRSLTLQVTHLGGTL